MSIKFEAILEKHSQMNATSIVAPFSVQEVFGSKAMVKVKGTIEGVPFRSVLMPDGKGNHYMVVKQQLRAATGKEAGEVVHIVMEKDTEERTIDIPEDFAAALTEKAVAKRIFDELSFTHRREYIEWIESAKKAETRQNRIVKAIEMIEQRKKLH